MENQYIISPFFLDESLPDLETLQYENGILNKPTLPNGDKQSRMSLIYQPLAKITQELAQSGKRPVSLCGDCCSAIAVCGGLQKAGFDPVLIWFDAHGDFNTWETTPSGFLGGMPLAMITGRGEQTLPEAVDLKTMDEYRIVLTDGRDLDPEEEVAIRQSTMYWLTNINDLNDHPLLEQQLYVHIDMDVINPTEVPAMNYPAAGGPGVAELGSVFKTLSKTGNIIGVSVSTWNPALDSDGESQKRCMDLIDLLVG